MTQRGIVRLGLAAAFVLLLSALDARGETIVREFGSFGSAPGQFIGMNGIAVDQTGRIYVTDPGNARVQVFEFDGTPVLQFGEAGSGDGQFGPPAAPNGIAVNRALERIYVSDSGSDRIQVFDLNGHFKFKWGSPGSGDSQFNDPSQIALDNDGNVYVADALNDRFQKFDADGHFVGKRGGHGTGPGQFDVLSGIAVDGLGRIYAADSLNDRVQVFDAAGTFLFQVGGPGSGDGRFTRPSHLAAHGALYVADTYNARVQVFDLAGHYLLQFPSGMAAEPFGLAVDRVGQIYLDRSWSVRVVTVDADADGLFDLWEMFGLDVDGDSVVDVNLPAMGADPKHKDLFLEFDWMTGFEPTRGAIQGVKEAFALAPVNAGGIPNPDGAPGISLWIDTGALTDANASEDGAGVGTCGDGTDNGSDGVADGADPDCLVGDNLGGGNAIAASDIGSLNAAFYTAKAANFATARALVFRYGMSARPKAGFGGGWGEIGGNDFIEYNHDAGTIMHEFGHTLNLRHGGFDDHNCKPSYVSVMNYDLQFGIRLNGPGGQDLDGDGTPDGRIIDYSPPRNSAGRGAAPLGTLAENALDEATVFDNTDPDNQLVFVNALGQKVRTGVNGPVNWNGDGDTTDSGLSVNIDTSGTDGRPPACTNTDITADPPGLPGSEDWTVIALNFRQFGDAADGAVNPDTIRDPDRMELLEMDRALNTTDLSIGKTASPDPVEVGEDLVYTVRVTNRGPNPAESVQLVDVLPPEVSYRSTTGACTAAPAGTLTCGLGRLGAGESGEVRITVGTAEVCAGGVPATLSNVATTSNVTANAGADLKAADNTVTLLTTPVDTTPPTLTLSVSPTHLWPPNHQWVPITASVTVWDLCDAAPAIRLVSITSDEPADATGDGHTPADVRGAQFGTDDRRFDLRAERSGLGYGRTYTITYAAEDGSGNVTTAQATVTVAKSQRK